MKIKVSEATKMQLGWLVAKCERYVVAGYSVKAVPFLGVWTSKCNGQGGDLIGALLSTDFWSSYESEYDVYPGREWSPSTDWAQGGPIIEREKISVFVSYVTAAREGADAEPTGWAARRHKKGVLVEPHSFGPTPLIAAMRCYCQSKLGDEVEIPEELT